MHSINIRWSEDHPCAACTNRTAAATLEASHWLVNAIYGRQLLELKLRIEHPDISVPTWTHSPELDPLLERMVDVLGLRDWPRPATLRARIRYLKTVLHMTALVYLGRPVPSWQAAVWIPKA